MEKKLNNKDKERVYAMYSGIPCVKHPCDSALFTYVGQIPSDFCTKNFYQGEMKPVLYGDWSGGTQPHLSAYGTCEWDDVIMELKDLSQISDEDAVEVAKIVQGENFYDSWMKDGGLVFHGKRFIQRTFNREDNPMQYTLHGIQIFQFLISRGYAVPLWFGIDHPCNGMTAITLGLAIKQE
jgi:hypothetical protein